MECQDVRLLLAFVDRKCEKVDAAERDLLTQHLEICPSCAESAQAERRLDQTLGTILRHVVVPINLKQTVLKRLTSERGGAPWRSGFAVAAAILLSLLGGLAWYNQAHPEINTADLQRIAEQGSLDAEAVERQLADNGIHVKIPREPFDFRYFQNYDIVEEFNGKRVAKLSFARLEEGRTVTASVLVLAPQQFRMKELTDGRVIPGTTSIRVHHEAGFINVIYYRGDLNSLREPVQH